MPSLLRTLLCSSVLAALLSTAVADPKVIHFPVAKGARSASSSLSKRDHFTSTLYNEEVQDQNPDGLFYYINITVGTPPQKFGVQLDTGSSDLWVISAVDTDDCENPYGTLGCDFGLYNSNLSSTYELVEAGLFNIEYGDGTEAAGDFIQESVGFGGGATVKKQIIGLANYTTGETYGLIGLGFDTNEANASEYYGAPYLSIMDNMKDQGLINVKAFSVWLDDLNSATGSILFGGIDRSKFTGELVGLPIQPDVSTYDLTSFTVSLTNLSFVDSNDTFKIYKGPAIPALLDSGTSLTYLPDIIATPLLNGIGVALDENTGLNFVPCSLNQTNANLTFGFGGSGGAVIIAPLKEFVSVPYLLDDGTIFQVNGSDVCLFGIMTSGDISIGAILGDAFLRSAYVVYDIENLMVGIAQTDFNPGPPDVVEYKVGQLGIPGVTATATEAVPTSVYLGDTYTTGSYASGPTVTDFPSGTFHLSTAAEPQATGEVKESKSLAAARSTRGSGIGFMAGLAVAVALV